MPRVAGAGKGEMKLWQRAAGALKDRNSIWVAYLSRKTSYRNSDLEAAIIKATSHDDLHVDYRNAQRVFAWIRTSPESIKALVWALSKRIDRTKSWVVALKGLILMHGVFCCKIPAVQKIGRLPFDLSSFHDGHSRPSKSWGFNNFVRAYYAFLDQRSAFLFEQTKRQEPPTVNELFKLQQWQTLLDLLLQIRPLSKNMKVALIFEALDCVLIEIYDVYSRICRGIARVLMGIYSAEKPEVEMAIKVFEKATEQGQALSRFLDFCRDFGVMNMLELPTIAQIPEEDIEDLKRIVYVDSASIDGKDNSKMESFDKVVDKAMVVNHDIKKCANSDEEVKLNQALRTIITDKWEVFDDDIKANEGINHFSKERENTCDHTRNPFLDTATLLPLIPVTTVPSYNDLPDLIVF